MSDPQTPQALEIDVLLARMVLPPRVFQSVAQWAALLAAQGIFDHYTRIKRPDHLGGYTHPPKKGSTA